jgi:hypothetical protein
MTATVRLTAILCLLAAGAAPLPFIAAPATAQEDGETRCGADGRAERFVVPNYGRPHWMSTTQSCRGRSGRYARNEEYYDAYAPPEDGESRCGGDGHVERFVRPNYGKPHWMSTTTRCRR